jgi:uncharacterized membrane protein
MAFCGKCGTQVQDGMGFCPTCGEQIGAASTQPSGYAPPAVPGVPVQTANQDAQDNKAIAIVAYFLFFVPLLMGAHKTSPFVKFHTNQGTILIIFAVAWNIAFGIVTSILSSILLGAMLFSGGLGLFGVLSSIITLLGFVPVVFLVLGIINAATGKMVPLPIIGNFTIIK